MSVLVSLHNIVNIPPTACEGDRVFRVEVVPSGATASQSTLPHITSSFSSKEIVQSSPGFFEARLDETAVSHRDNNECSAAAWHQCADPSGLLEVTVTVTEISPSDSSMKRSDGGGNVIVGTSAPLVVNVEDLIEHRKLTTCIAGTECGQVGFSFSVDPADISGYRRRLEAFLQRYNPKGLHLVDNVVEVVPEVDTFTKLYKKYKLQDYAKRLRSFLSVYGPEYIAEIPSLLQQWENREEELMRNLILDNGSELCDVDVEQRLEAFLAAHGLRRQHPALVGMLSAYRKNNDAAALFAKLTTRFGPEPDPRTYLYPEPHYPPTKGNLSPSSSSSAAVEKGEDKDVYTPLPPPLVDKYEEIDEDRDSGEEEDKETLHATGGSHPAHFLEQHRSASSIAAAAARGVPTYYKDRVFSSSDSIHQTHRSPPPPLPQAAAATTAIPSFVPSSPAESVWSRMCGALSRPMTESDLFYLSAAAFQRIVSQQGNFTKAEQEALLAAWESRVAAAVQEEHLSPDDTRYDVAVTETASLTGLQPLHLQAMAVTVVLNREHYVGFSKCAAATGGGGGSSGACTRAALVGERSALMNIVRYGCSSAMFVDAAGAGIPTAATPPCAVFLQEPFRHCHSRRSACLLICDIVLGHTSRDTSTRGPIAFSNNHHHQGTSYDSAMYVDPTSGSALAVRTPQQVLPRLLLQCTIDPCLVACPAHPSRAVEYYVTEAHAFACSRCVVMGDFRGKEVTPIEEAAVLARSRLAEIQRTAAALGESMAAFEKRLTSEEELMPTSERRRAAELEVTRLRQEVEERVRAIMEAVERADAKQLARIVQDRSETAATLVAAQTLSGEIARFVGGTNAMGGGDGTGTGGNVATVAPVQVITALQRVQQERRLEQLLERARARTPAAVLELVLPLESATPSLREKPLPAAGSSSNINVSPFGPRGKRMGLNESLVTPARGAATGGREGGHRGAGEHISDSALRARHPHSDHRVVPQYGHLDPERQSESEIEEPKDDLYAQYLSIASAKKQYPLQQQQPIRMTGGSGVGSNTMDATSMMSEGGSSMKHRETIHKGNTSSPFSAQPHRYPPQIQQLQEKEEAAKQWLTRGWALLREGDLEGAREAWERVYNACGDPTRPSSSAFPSPPPSLAVLSAKAQAYICEAIDKDYDAAAEWYTLCLQLDPVDRMTAYNYGVLLEALLGRPEDALTLYERAAELGDQAAARRAEQLRYTLQQ